MSDNKIKAPYGEQGCYELGYSNPGIPARKFIFRHVVFVNAYVAGQSDSQNYAPCTTYERKNYDVDTLIAVNVRIIHRIWQTAEVAWHAWKVALADEKFAWTALRKARQTPDDTATVEAWIDAKAETARAKKIADEASIKADAAVKQHNAGDEK